MRVLVIPEDVRKDQYMLKPVIEGMMKAKDKKRAKVIVCQNPRLRGISQALKWKQLEQIIEQYKSRIDLYLLCVDRDGTPGRRDALNNIERQAANILPEDKQFLAENAWQEIEVWVLAGHTLPKKWNWDEVRAEVNPKEIYFLPFAKQRNLLDEPGEGRKTLALEAAKRYSRIRQLCPEVAELERRIK
ncbi:MAG: hypothetical protein GY792_03025 [Gammaproteobacteria bacterium]|nr:hypothetical protein [Gammaproteobacteria bacterium]